MNINRPDTCMSCCFSKICGRRYADIECIEFWKKIADLQIIQPVMEIALVVECLKSCGCNMSLSTKDDCIRKLNAVIAKICN